MGTTKTLGGDRLGSGNKNKVRMHGFERSTHDLGYLWRSSMAAGTLVPFMSEVALPGDDWKIKLNANVLTHPTIGPLFGSYKVQLDVFLTPIRLYNPLTHMNALEIGNDMSKIYLPQIRLKADGVNVLTPNIDNSQINECSIFSYLDIRGLGSHEDESQDIIDSRDFNAVPWLIYWDIFKNYYSNKQEENAYVIHNDLEGVPEAVTIDSASALMVDYSSSTNGNLIAIPLDGSRSTASTYAYINPTLTRIRIGVTNWDADIDTDRFQIGIYQEELMTSPVNTFQKTYKLSELFESVQYDPGNNAILAAGIKNVDNILTRNNNNMWTTQWENFYFDREWIRETEREPKLYPFPLKNIDEMKKTILRSDGLSPFILQYDHPTPPPGTTIDPYNLALKEIVIEPGISHDYSKLYSQEGLAVKTYQSDLFNNWINTEWLDGDNGINQITKITVDEENSFTLDELNLNKRLYKMLMRIAVSGGTFKDWIEVTYDHERFELPEMPIYCGGLSKELAFEEVISNSETVEQPLGTLAGRGKLTGKHKGGYITIKVNEPSYITGIVSLTPRVDYSQGNKWDVNLKTFADLHTPLLDEIGYQELLTDQMAWWDTQIRQVSPGNFQTVFKSAGKQPAWINYMTNVNKVRGTFAKENEQMWMTLNRRYEKENWNDSVEVRIKDLTTYIDPAKFNYIFADTRRDAQNFWTQISVDIEARRKMSARMMPNV